MPKKPVSLTLDESNLLWLRGREPGRGNLSAAVDALIAEARAGRLKSPSPVRSVVGTIDLAADDPDLDRADATVRDLVAASLARPFVGQAGRAAAVTQTKPKRSRRRG